MASFPDLRPQRRSANAESTAAPRFRTPVLLAVSAALLLTASFAVSELATLRGAKAHDASAFLTRELGPPQSQASLVRTPTHDAKIEFTQAGLAAGTKHGRLTLASTPSAKGTWMRYEHGVARPTSFGQETITTSGTQVEQFLTVTHRQGLRTWTWDLGTTLEPRSRPDGTIPTWIVPASSRSTTVAMRRGSRDTASNCV